MCYTDLPYTQPKAKVSLTVTVNPFEFKNSSAAIQSISDLDVSDSCFLNRIDLEEQETQHRKNIRTRSWNENEVLCLFLSRYINKIYFKGSLTLVGYELKGNCQIDDELRREISGLSQLASELYSVTQTSDTDRVSLDR